MSGFEVEKESNFCRIYKLSSSACQLAAFSALLGWTALLKEDGTDLAASFGLLLSSKVGLVIQATAVTLAAVYACRKSGLSKCRYIHSTIRNVKKACTLGHLNFVKKF